MSSNKTVPVAEYRRAYDRLHRKVNDYHACCSADEVSHWKGMTQRVLTEVSNISCSRAKPYDVENMAKAIEKVQGYLAAADERIEGYHRAAVARSAEQASKKRFTEYERHNVVSIHARTLGNQH